MDTVLLYSIESFPPMRESITRINKLFMHEEIDTKAFIAIIESDPILYTDILHFSNAPHHGFRHAISTIAQAISLFGAHSVRGMALSAALKAHPYTDVSPYGITMQEWFGVMEKQQRFLDLWLGKTHRSLLQSVGGLTFILEIGRLVAAYALMFTDNPYTFTKRKPHELILEERNIIGRSGDELASKLFELWFFNDAFVDALRHSLTPAYGFEPKTCAALECARLLFTLYGIEPFETVEPVLRQFSLPAESAQAAYDILLKE